jgi:hypothetical protein
MRKIAISDARGTRLANERRDATDREAQAEVKKVDAWLRAQLENGPVPRDAVRDAATAAGIALRGVGLATLGEAMTRVGVFVVVRIEEPGPQTPYWCVGRAPEGFEVPRADIRSSQMASAMRFSVELWPGRATRGSTRRRTAR